MVENDLNKKTKISLVKLNVEQLMCYVFMGDML